MWLLCGVPGGGGEKSLSGNRKKVVKYKYV